jgi:ABC-type multidrug transport system fused ATPase/permease subunit
MIHVVEEGHVIESGTWDELVTKNGRLKELCTAQGIR